MRTIHTAAAAAGLLALALGAGCHKSSHHGGAKCDLNGGLDISVCDAANANFSLTIDNQFYPLEVGRKLVLDGMDGGDVVHLEVTVLPETVTISGVTTRVVEERESTNGELDEVSRNYFAQAPDGTVCYFGEDVDIIQNGQVVNHGGAWRAEGNNHAGIVMPGAPAIGQIMKQEDAPGVAEDRAEIEALGETITVPAGTFSDTLRTRECSTLESGNETKVYVRGIGVAIDETLKLTSHTP